MSPASCFALSGAGAASLAPARSPARTLRQLADTIREAHVTDTRFISLDEDEEFVKRSKPECGDLLISKCGAIGSTQMGKAGENFSILVGVALVKLDRAKVLPGFVKQLLNTDIYRHRMEVAAPGGTRATLTTAALQKLGLQLPASLDEQRKITVLPSVCDQQIHLLGAKLTLLREQKRGLMQQRLTGKVRVKA